jgi:hypothetical protein
MTLQRNTGAPLAKRPAATGGALHARTRPRTVYVCTLRGLLRLGSACLREEAVEEKGVETEATRSGGRMWSFPEKRKRGGERGEGRGRY